MVRSKVEHVFGVIKLKFGFVKLRYRGLKKHADQLFPVCALVNLYLVRKKLLALARLSPVVKVADHGRAAEAGRRPGKANSNAYPVHGEAATAPKNGLIQCFPKQFSAPGGAVPMPCLHDTISRKRKQSVRVFHQRTFQTHSASRAVHFVR